MTIILTSLEKKQFEEMDKKLILLGRNLTKAQIFSAACVGELNLKAIIEACYKIIKNIDLNKYCFYLKKYRNASPKEIEIAQKAITNIKKYKKELENK